MRLRMAIPSPLFFLQSHQCFVKHINLFYLFEFIVSSTQKVLTIISCQVFIRSLYVIHVIKYGWPCPMDRVGPMSDIGVMGNHLNTHSKRVFHWTIGYM